MDGNRTVVLVTGDRTIRSVHYSGTMILEGEGMGNHPVESRHELISNAEEYGNSRSIIPGIFLRSFVRFLCCDVHEILAVNKRSRTRSSTQDWLSESSIRSLRTSLTPLTLIPAGFTKVPY